MVKKNITFCIDYSLCKILLPELRAIEKKCDNITAELSEVKKLVSSLPLDIGALIDIIGESAQEMRDQSTRHREYVERCIKGESDGCIMKIVR